MHYTWGENKGKKVESLEPQKKKGFNDFYPYKK